jgi:hypothetical protein
MISSRLETLHRGQQGLTAVEMIITMALTGIVIGAIFSVYLLLYRVQTTFQDKSQAQALGLVAEQPLMADLQRYTVTDTSPDLVLSAASTPSGATFSVTYHLDASTNRLTRIVTGDPRPTVVAHGIKMFTASCGTSPTPGVPPTVSVSMRVDGLSGTEVQVNPDLTVALRNQAVCP